MFRLCCRCGRRYIRYHWHRPLCLRCKAEYLGQDPEVWIARQQEMDEKNHLIGSIYHV